MNTTYDIKRKLDPDLYVRLLPIWRAQNGPRRNAQMRDIRPYLDPPQREAPPPQAHPYRLPYLMTAICTITALVLVLISLGCG